MLCAVVATFSCVLGAPELWKVPVHGSTFAARLTTADGEEELTRRRRWLRNPPVLCVLVELM